MTPTFVRSTIPGENERLGHATHWRSEKGCLFNGKKRAGRSIGTGQIESLSTVLQRQSVVNQSRSFTGSDVRRSSANSTSGRSTSMAADRAGGRCAPQHQTERRLPSVSGNRRAEPVRKMAERSESRTHPGASDAPTGLEAWPPHRRRFPCNTEATDEPCARSDERSLSSTRRRSSMRPLRLPHPMGPADHRRGAGAGRALGE